MVKAPWKMKSIAAAARPEGMAIEVAFSTFQIRPVWTTITAAMREIMERNRGRRPMRSMRNPVSSHVSVWVAWGVVGEEERTRNKGSEEEPGVQHTRHECRQLLVEAKTVLEKGGRIVDESIDAAQLLEDLHW
jgi:hypothetical protein